MTKKTANTILALSLTVSLAGFASAFAQSQAPAGDRSYQVAQGTVGEAEEKPQAEDRALSRKIEKARQAGQNVAAAEDHQRQGEAAMSTGDNLAARRQFEQAEAALGESQENKKHEEKSVESR